MPAFFKRIEVWLLLAMAAGLGYYVLSLPDDSGDAAESSPAGVGQGEGLVSRELVGPPAPSGQAEAEKPPPLRVSSVHVETVEQGWIVHLTLSGRSSTGSGVVLDESTVRATAENGGSLPLFFEPFQIPVVLSADEDREAVLKFWMQQPASSLSLVVQGNTLHAGW